MWGARIWVCGVVCEVWGVGVGCGVRGVACAVLVVGCEAWGVGCAGWGLVWWFGGLGIRD